MDPHIYLYFFLLSLILISHISYVFSLPGGGGNNPQTQQVKPREIEEVNKYIGQILQNINVKKFPLNDHVANVTINIPVEIKEQNHQDTLSIIFESEQKIRFLNAGINFDPKKNILSLRVLIRPGKLEGNYIIYSPETRSSSGRWSYTDQSYNDEIVVCISCISFLFIL